MRMLHVQLLMIFHSLVADRGVGNGPASVACRPFVAAASSGTTTVSEGTNALADGPLHILYVAVSVPRLHRTSIHASACNWPISIQQAYKVKVTSRETTYIPTFDPCMHSMSSGRSIAPRVCSLYLSDRVAVVQKRCQANAIPQWKG